MSIETAKIHFNELGTPIASDFDDVYFSNANGLEESQYVFFDNNDLSARWLQWQKNEFVIAETGFGTGLNFLQSLQNFMHFRQSTPDAALRNLYFISVEKFPLKQTDLEAALTHWPQLADLSRVLVVNYPMPVSGCHRLQFDLARLTDNAIGSVTLDLHFGDVAEVFPALYAGRNGRVDAWYLDGFAPSKNPEMWTDALFEQMARLARKDCTFATFTAAGFVKRGLKAAGFEVEKRKGFGHKRDMLGGKLVEKSPASNLSYRYRAVSQLPTDIAIIGGGLAAANLAWSFAQRGLNTQIYCADNALATGASGNAQGGFYPQLNADASPGSQIQALSFLFARRRYLDLLALGYSFEHQWCGVLQVGFNDNVRLRQQNLTDKRNWPAELIHAVDPQQSEQMANVSLPYSGLFIPQGGWISPKTLTHALLTASIQKTNTRVHLNKMLVQLTRRSDGWTLHFADGSQSDASQVILACGAQLPKNDFLDPQLFRLVRGQVEAIPAQQALAGLTTVLCHKGYLTPAEQGRQALGSTYVKQDESCDYRHTEGEQNLATQRKSLADCEWPSALEHDFVGRASTRCSTPDHLPLSGGVPAWHTQRQLFAELYKARPDDYYPLAAEIPDLYVLGGLGSRGLTTAPLLAELLVSQILGHPLPLAQPLLDATSPNRFLIRKLIRREED